MYYNQPKQKIIIQLIKTLLIGFAALFFAFWFVFYVTDNPLNEFLLITKGIEVSGKIYQAEEFVEDGDDGKAIFSYSYAYSFKLPDGKEIKSGDHSGGRLPNELLNSNLPFPIMILYLKSDPNINKLKSTLSKNIFEFIWRKIGLGTIFLILFSSIGISVIKNGIKDYNKSMKELSGK
jgi:hypothetical protein